MNYKTDNTHIAVKKFDVRNFYNDQYFLSTFRHLYSFIQEEWALVSYRSNVVVSIILKLNIIKFHVLKNWKANTITEL